MNVLYAVVGGIIGGGLVMYLAILYEFRRQNLMAQRVKAQTL